MSSPNHLFSYDKEEMLRALQRFDGEITGYDAVDSVKHDSSRYIHTGFLEVLLECICGGIVKNEAKREILLAEVCKRLSESKLIDQELLFHTLPLRKQLSKMFLDFIKEVSDDVLSEEEIDLSAIAFLEEDVSSFNKIYKDYFTELEQIGKGGFGTVYKVKNKMSNTLYAVKKIFFKYKNDSRLRKVIREAKNIAALNHPNVVHYDNAWTESPSSDDDFDYSSSEDEDDNNSTYNNCDNEVSFSENTNEFRIKKDVSYSSKSIFFSRSEKSNKVVHSPSKYCKENSFNEDSDSIIFSENISNSFTNVAWSVGNTKNNNSYTSDSRETEENDSPDSNDSGKSDDSLNLNLKAILYIQMEYCDCDLRLWLDERAKGNPLPFVMNVVDMFINILNGVVHIHSKNIIHRDLKPQNIFYSSISGTLKIGDFGLATLDSTDTRSGGPVLHPLSSNIGTLPYAAPEQINCQEYDTKVDIYSLGIILIELLNSFSTVMELSKSIKEIKKDNFPKEMEKSPKLMSLVKNLVDQNPKVRMSAKEILNYLQEDAMVTVEARALAVQKKEMELIEKEACLNEFYTRLKEREIFLNQTEDALKQSKDALKQGEEALKQKVEALRQREEALLQREVAVKIKNLKL